MQEPKKVRTQELKNARTQERKSGITPYSIVKLDFRKRNSVDISIISYRPHEDKQ